MKSVCGGGGGGGGQRLKKLDFVGHKEKKLSYVYGYYIIIEGHHGTKHYLLEPFWNIFWNNVGTILEFIIISNCWLFVIINNS